MVAVFWRYLLNSPIYGTEDISVLALSVVAAAAVVYGARHDAHVSINVIDAVFPPAVTRITDALMRALTAGIALLAGYALTVKACGMAKACITRTLRPWGVVNRRAPLPGDALEKFKGRITRGSCSMNCSMSF